MPTTALLVEIIIVGIGCLFSFAPIVSLTFGVDIPLLLKYINNLPLHWLLVVSYPLGIVWNRVCDQVFFYFDKQIILKKFQTKEAYQSARIEVVLQGESIRDYIGNFRSLIRISRAFFVMLISFLLTSPVFLWIRTNLFLDITPNLRVWVFIALIIFTFLSGYAWLKLANGYISAVHDAYKIVVDKSVRSKKRRKNGTAQSK